VFAKNRVSFIKIKTRTEKILDETEIGVFFFLGWEKKSSVQIPIFPTIDPMFETLDIEVLYILL
jgi:hypothetical protein